MVLPPWARVKRVIDSTDSDCLGERKREQLVLSSAKNLDHARELQ